MIYVLYLFPLLFITCNLIVTFCHPLPMAFSYFFTDRLLSDCLLGINGCKRNPHKKQKCENRVPCKIFKPNDCCQVFSLIYWDRLACRLIPSSFSITFRFFKIVIPQARLTKTYTVQGYHKNLRYSFDHSALDFRLTFSTHYQTTRGTDWL